MHPALVGVCVALLVVSTPGHAGSVHAAPGAGAPALGLPRADVVAIRVDVSRASIADINADYSTTVLDTVPEMPGLYLLRVAPGNDVPKLLYRMMNDRRLVYAEADIVSKSPLAYPRSISVWNDQNPTLFEQQLAVSALGMLSAHAITRGAGSIVAVIDTGVQLDHPVLAASFTTERFDFVDNDADPTDNANALDDDGDRLIDEAYGHGTHVAGIVHLVAPDAKIMPLRVLEADGSGNVFAVAKAVAWASRRGANVINLSLGAGQPSLVMHDAVEAARKLGVIVVAAAGNADALDKQFPAADTDAIGITSVDTAGAKSSFANYGQWVDLAAIGENIISTYPGGYAAWTGTSFATPFVSGQAALIRSVAPTWTVAMIVCAMRQTATPLARTNRQYNELLGAGVVNIGASIEWTLADSALAHNSDIR
jgi:thermitase